VLGDYDFINNGLYDVSFADNNDLLLLLQQTNQQSLKLIFQRRLKATGHNERIIRLGEASLFLSMLPLHIDYPNKVMAFMLKAKQILDEVESG
jgi:predicted lipid carrier protein YhbT